MMRIFTLAMLLCLARPVHAQLTLTGDPTARLLWSRTFSSPGDDWINDIVPLGGGRHLAVGFLERGEGRDWRALAVTLDDDGTILDRQEYGQGGGIDAFWSAAPGPDGFVFAGFTTRIGAGGIDAWVLRANANGLVASERSFGGAGYDRFTGMARAGEGFVFIGHSQLPGEERRRLFAVRTDASGAPVWERMIEGPESISPLYIEPARGGGFIVAGGISVDGDDDILVMKLDDDGREVWRRRVGSSGAPDINHGLAVLPNGDIVVAGYSRSWGAEGNDILAATLSADGMLLRAERLGGAGDDRPILIRADTAGRVWIVGSTQSAGAGGWDVIMARLDRRGAFAPGIVTLGGPSDDHGTAIRPLADGSVLVAGYSMGLGGGAEDAFVVRISSPTWTTPHPAFRRLRVR